jgi:hypothetical protein
MKNIVTVFFLLSCGLVVLLATVDLEPYLAVRKDVKNGQTVTIEDPLKAATNSTVSTSQPSVIQPKPAETSPEETFENGISSLDEDETGREHLANLPPAALEVTVQNSEDGRIGIDSSSQPEFEVSILPVGEYPFSILLETFTDQEIAQMAIPFYQKQGISAHWVKVDLDERGIYYRLFTGVFATIPEAQQYLDKKQLGDKPVKPTSYSARTGIYKDKAQLASAYTKISEAGVIPYVLATEEGTYHLYVGSFYTFIGAADQCRDLNDAGLSCEPVKRSTITPR